jgi:hypothetical protein
VRPSVSLLVGLLLVGCVPRHGSPGRASDGADDPALQERYRDWSIQVRRELLDRNTVPPPTVSFDPQTQEQDGVRVTVSPILAEKEAWNAWPDGTARLFNDSVGYLFRVHVESAAPARWNPARTSLAVNDTDLRFAVATTPDEVLQQLLDAARVEQAVAGRGDLNLRARSADDFRRAYLPTEPAAGPRDGIVVFPAPARSLQALAMEVTVGVVVDGAGGREFKFLFE